MTRLALAFAVLWLVAHAAFATCAPHDTTLCLNQQRFAIDVGWTDFGGNTGAGHAVALTGDTGYFWFFNDTNVELVIKVLDATTVNQHFWVYYGSLSNVAYSIHIVDTATGHERTYTNPLGTFASFGDTSAFPSSNGPAVASAPGAPRSDADTACPTDPNSLYLSQCRFRVEAKWKDFAGNTGTGNAVRLTSDTGYFWFFNDTNVELVLKVLDATSFSKKFWVFFGALSNVEYTVTVTDTVTGNVKTYVNPSGQFASIGDTAAFPSGSTVKATADDTRATSATIGTSGGTVAATAADGSRFTLTLPAGALMSDATIALTPVTSVAGLPLSGGLRAAVQIAPEGLRLFAPATLTIESPSPASGKTIGFAYHRSGDEFHLYPAALDGGKATMALMHFSGYGVGSGTDADVQAQQQRTPASAEDKAQQDIAAGEERFAAIQAWWLAIQATLQTATASDPSVFEIALTQFYAWQALALTDPRGAALVETAWLLIVQDLQIAINQSYLGCHSSPGEISRFLRLVALTGRPDIQARAGGSLAFAQGLVGKCLTFQLLFDSHMELDSQPTTWDSTVHAEVTFSEEMDATYRLIVAPASGPLKYLKFATHYDGCTASTQTTDSTFRIVNDAAGELSRIKFPFSFGWDPYVSTPFLMPADIRLTILHGDPGDRVLTLTCGNPPLTQPVPSGPMWWRAAWGEFHGGFLGENEVVDNAGYQIRNWTFLGGRVWAQKTYTRSYSESGVTQSENTTLKLIHTPR